MSEDRRQRAEVRGQRTEGGIRNGEGEKAKGSRQKRFEAGRIEGEKIKQWIKDYGLRCKRGNTSAPNHPNEPNHLNLSR